MIFVDTNVFAYAIGTPHPLRGEARVFFKEHGTASMNLCTSAEVIQELLHLYRPVDRLEEMRHALEMIADAGITVWPLEYEDAALAATLATQHPTLSARDLCHFASCQRRGITQIKTYDRALATAFA